MFERRDPEKLFRAERSIESRHVDDGRDQSGIREFKERKVPGVAECAVSPVVTVHAAWDEFRVTVEASVVHPERREDPAAQEALVICPRDLFDHHPEKVVTGVAVCPAVARCEIKRQASHLLPSIGPRIFTLTLATRAGDSFVTRKTADTRGVIQQQLTGCGVWGRIFSRMLMPGYGQSSRLEPEGQNGGEALSSLDRPYLPRAFRARFQTEAATPGPP